MTTKDVPDVTTTSPSDWEYIAEGGASIVFAYHGRPNAVFDNTVLRLRKAPVDLDPHVHTEEELEGEPDDKSIAFQERVISKLIPPEYLPKMVVAKVSTEWLEALAERVKNDYTRPLERREVDVIDVHHRKAVLSNDLVGHDGLAVEIKPKWGFMPKQTHLSQETREAKTTRCRYCLHSHVRSKNGKVTSRGYCPLDLYSGDERRVTTALRRLWNAWIASDGTVNNIRLFVNGKLLDPNNLDDLSALSEQFSQTDALSSMAGQNVILMNQFTRTLLPLIIKKPILRIIANHQRNLDALDIEGLIALERTFDGLSHSQSFTYLKDDPTLEEWEAFVKDYLDPEFQSKLDHDNPDPKHLHYYMMAYLLSGTFKDCSLMFKLGKAGSKSGNVTVIDMDPKSITRLKKWAELDKEIAVAFVDEEEGRICFEHAPTVPSVPAS